jgi:type I restriction-modification system DNA methylase subunit
MLKINGKCAVVLPDGQDLFSKTNKTLITLREYLIKTCDLKEIIYLPYGVFTNTSIKTCIMYFVKKMEGIDVLKTKNIISKT